MRSIRLFAVLLVCICLLAAYKSLVDHDAQMQSQRDNVVQEIQYCRTENQRLAAVQRTVEMDLRRQLSEANQNLDTVFGIREYPKIHAKYLAESQWFVHRLPAQPSAAMSAALARGLCLEIGPLCFPSLPPSHQNSRFLDYTDQNGLREHIAADPDPAVRQNADNVPFINYIWKSGLRYQELVGTDRFQLIIASHVIEHIPDPIGFINELSEILVDGGEVWLVIPDKNYCFDFRRPVTSLSDLIAAHVENQSRAPPKLVYDFLANYGGGNYPAEIWEGKMGRNFTVTAERHRFGLSESKRAANGEYLNIHLWAWSPEFFVSHFLFLQSQEMISLRVKELSVVPTERNKLDFTVAFVKAP